MSGKLPPESFPEYSAIASTSNPDSLLSQQPQLAPEYVILIRHNCKLNENEVIQKSPNSSPTFFLSTLSLFPLVYWYTNYQPNNLHHQIAPSDPEIISNI
jgi:hypothetical protein